MNDLHLEATSRTPAIALDTTAGKLMMTGESYPEDVTGFFATLTGALSSFFEGGGDSLKTEIRLTYFNSSSARALMELLELLDDAASKGVRVSVDWYCDPDDDITREFAEDIAADVSNASVSILDLDVE